MNNVYALVLAGGIGQRMGNIEKPKQFIELQGKPIIVHTVEKFYLNPCFDSVIVLSPKEWLDHTKNLLKKHLAGYDGFEEADGGNLNDGNNNKTGTDVSSGFHIKPLRRLAVMAGGATRNETLMNGIRYIKEQGKLDDETVIVTHDAVRPFVTTRIIEENIEAARKYGACDTVVPATDTIVESGDGMLISKIPNRRHMYQGQTPQSFKAAMLWELYHSLDGEEKETLTDAAKICVIKGRDVRLVDGETYNIKITYPHDINMAKTLLKGGVT